MAVAEGTGQGMGWVLLCPSTPRVEERVPRRAPLPFCPGALVGAGVALPGGGFGAVSPRGRAGDAVLFPTPGTGTGPGKEEDAAGVWVEGKHL